MINIEPYRQDDFDTLVRFVSSIQEYERGSVPELKTGDMIGVAYAAHLLDSVKNNNGTILIAKDQGRPVGLVCAWLEEDSDMLLRDEFRSHAYISDLFLVEEWRGKNIAQMLMKEIEQVFRNKGCQRIRVCSKAPNERAVAFYKASGFIPYEIIFSKKL